MKFSHTVGLVSVVVIIGAAVGAFVVFDSPGESTEDPSEEEEYTQFRIGSYSAGYSNVYADSGNYSSDLILSNTEVSRELSTRLSDEREMEGLSSPNSVAEMSRVARLNSFSVANDSVEQISVSERYNNSEVGEICDSYRSMTFETDIEPDSFSESQSPDYPPAFAVSSTLLNESQDNSDFDRVVNWDAENVATGVGVHFVASGEGFQHSSRAIVTVDSCSYTMG